MRFLGILFLLYLGLRSTAFKLLHEAKNDHPRGFGTAKHAVIIGKFSFSYNDKYLNKGYSSRQVFTHIFMHGKISKS